MSTGQNESKSLHSPVRRSSSLVSKLPKNDPTKRQIWGKGRPEIKRNSRFLYQRILERQSQRREKEQTNKLNGETFYHQIAHPEQRKKRQRDQNSFKKRKIMSNEQKNCASSTATNHKMKSWNRKPHIVLRGTDGRNSDIFTKQTGAGKERTH